MSSSSTPSGPSLCLKGGGFLAFAVHAGLTTGLLRASALKKDDPQFDLNSSELFGRIKTISSNSGGTWYASQLMYSENFLKLIHDMATKEKKDDVTNLFMESWTQPWIHVNESDGEDKIQTVDTIMGLLQDIKLFFYFLRTKKGVTWENFVSTLLNTTAGLKDDLTLGSPVLPWCQGKKWIICTAAVTPKSDSTNTIAAPLKDQEKMSVKYNTKGNSRLYTPTNFSVVLGGGETPPPLGFAAKGALDKVVLEYQGNSTPVTAEPSMLPMTPASGSFAQVPLFSAVASSSAFAGGMTTLPVSPEIPILGTVNDPGTHYSKFDFNVWYAAAEPLGSAYETAAGMVKKLRESDNIENSELNEISRKKLYALIDGGYVDNTAVINAVASGSTELFVWLDGMAEEEDKVEMEGFFHLFSNAPTDDQDGKLMPVEYFTIFQETYDVAKSTATAFAPLKKPHLRSSYLTSIRVGTITATTVANDEVGVKGGIPITMHIVDVEAKVSIGDLQNFDNYAVLVGEIAETIASEKNSKAVDGFLKLLYGL